MIYNVPRKPISTVADGAHDCWVLRLLKVKVICDQNKWNIFYWSSGVHAHLPVILAKD